jgi:hypothetical protein
MTLGYSLYLRQAEQALLRSGKTPAEAKNTMNLLLGGGGSVTDGEGRTIVYLGGGRTPTDPNLAEKQAKAKQDVIDALKEDKYGQLHPETASDHNIWNMENVQGSEMFWATMLLLGMKNPASVEKILTTMFGGVSKALEAYCRAGAANRISAWGSGRLLSLYMERLGMITQPQATAYSDGINIVSGATIAADFVGVILPWKLTSQDTQFPDTVTLSDTGETNIVQGGLERRRDWSIGSKSAAKKTP